MAHLGTLSDFRFEDEADDIRGAALYGRDDEKLGKIHDVIFDHSTGAVRYVVVETGGWLRSKLFLVPADRIHPRGEKHDEYVTNLSKKQIENFPPYDESALNDEKRWGEYEREYRGVAKFEETGGVLHQAGGTNILVPEGLPAEGPAPKIGCKPISGYKSPIRHREVGLMDTTPTAIGNKPDYERLTFVPDAIGANRGDIEDKEIGTMPGACVPASGAPTPNMNVNRERSQSAPNVADRSVGEAADVARSTRARDIVHREDDRYYHTDRGSKLAPFEQTIEGDAIFNSEDIRGRMHESGNIHDADEPSYDTIAGSPTETAEGRLPNYPDAGQGQRWARFEENLRRQRPKIVGRCSVCDEFQNRHREDVA
jgi:sporulation protein YlmC with PRC-barrel domain